MIPAGNPAPVANGHVPEDRTWHIAGRGRFVVCGLDDPKIRRAISPRAVPRKDPTCARCLEFLGYGGRL